jgi:hypothetical protein
VTARAPVALRFRPIGLAAALLVTTLSARGARAQSFVQRVSGDACEQARSFERSDSGPVAQEARRACRLQRFENKLAVERQDQVMAQVEEREARVEKWLNTTQPARVLHPVALEAFTSTGLASYGLALSYMALSQLEFAASIGWRTLGFDDTDPKASGTAEYKDRTLAFTSRWYVANRELTPFLGAGIGLTTADLKVFWYGKDGTPAMDYPEGNARGHSMSAHAGVQLATRNLRLSIEYVFQYVFFTGANLADMTKTPNEQMRIVWQETLDDHRQGIQLRVGYAF